MTTQSNRNLFISSQDIRTIDKFNGFEVSEATAKNPPCGEADCCESDETRNREGYKLVFRECHKKPRWSSGSNRCLAIKFNWARIPVATHCRH